MSSREERMRQQILESQGRGGPGTARWRVGNDPQLKVMKDADFFFGGLFDQAAPPPNQAPAAPIESGPTAEEIAAQKAEEARLKDEADRAQFATDLGASRDTTRSGIDRAFADLGFTASDDQNLRIEGELDRAQEGITFGQQPQFDAGIGASIMDTLRQNQINQFQTEINQFAPQGFADQRFGATADDDIINSILGGQFDSASGILDNALARGQLNQQGFDFAQGELGNQRTTANSRLQSTGGGILSGFRGQLDDIVGNARAGAGGYNFGDDFNTAGFADRLSARSDDLSGRLEGDIRGAIGGEQFFNTGSLIQQGGINQGAVNTGQGGASSGLLRAIADRDKTNDSSRGLGSQGSF